MSYYPPRSRSRSPRSRASYMDTNPDPYRSDWEYDRYGSYDRDRGYDYGRRGRSRSPPPGDDIGRKRRRTPSPYDRDRYEPRPRYDDYDGHSRGGYGGYSPRRSYGSSYPPAIRRPPPDPHTFEYPASLKQFAEWFRFFHPQEATDEDNADKAAEQEAGDGSKPRNGIKSRWEKYKKDFAANQLQTMFDHHKKFPWFAEKYDPAPEMHNLRMRVRKEGWKGRIDNFLHDLENGKFDPDLNESEDAANKDSVTNGEPETNGANDESKPADEDITFNDADDDAPGDEPTRGDANGRFTFDKRNNRGEEISVATEGNQIMIRTIPPDIGRVKLEDACGKISGFIHLALGDPLQKRNFYRAGWMKFSDDADIPAVLTELTEKKIEGFKLHVTHNIKPFVNKIRYTPDVASKPERLQKDLITVKQLAMVLEEQAATLRHYKPTKSGTEQEPVPEGEATEHMNGEAENGDSEDDPEPMENGSEAVERRIEKVMSDMREHGLVDLNDEKAYDEKKTVISLDLYLAYIRAAYNTCYYCSVVTDHVEELQRKCIKHVRKPLSKALQEQIRAEAEKKEKEEGDEMEDVQVEKEKEKEKEAKDNAKGGDKRNVRNDDRWLEWLDSKLALLINRDNVDPRAYMGKNYDDELAKAVEPHVKQEDEGKFRCKTCQKLFKATSFVEKHISNKHPELVKTLDEQLPYFNNFALDPHHIQPFTHPPPTTGNTSSQAPPPQAYGIQPPPAYHGADYGRPAHYPPPGGYPPGGYPPPYHTGHFDPYYQGGGGGPYGGPPMGYPPPPSSRRDESLTARRLSERISGYANNESSSLPPGIGLPPKPSPAALDQALTSGGPTGSGGGGGGGGGGRRRNGAAAGGPPPPPPDAKEDPRAAGGKRVSYHDMDSVAEGDVELMY